MASFSGNLFQFVLAVRPTTFPGTAAVFIVALLSRWSSLRAVGCLDLARSSATRRMPSWHHRDR